MIRPVFRRSFALVLALPALLAQGLVAQGAAALLPHEAEAMQARAGGDEAQVALLLLQAAAELANGPAADPANSARVEALATEAARTAPPEVLVAVLEAIDSLRAAPMAQADPLLCDRLAIAALTAAGDYPAGHPGERANELGFVRDYQVIGPFANERGSGFATELAPEKALDLGAELQGKRRAVRWRKLPPLVAEPVLPLEAVLHPHEQTLAFAALAVIAESDRSAVLEFGSTGACRVFVRGSEVFARDVERDFAFDQESVRVSLRAGPNLVLFKIGHQEGAQFRFAARFRALDGSALTGVSMSADAADLTAAAAAADRPAAVEATDASVALGGRSIWQIGKAQGADALRLGWLWRARAADGDRDRRDRAAALAAVAALPDAAEAHLLLAAACERHGRSAADQDDNERRRALEEALRVSPDNVAALVQLGTLLSERSRLHQEALELADRALARRPGHAGAMLLRGAALRGVGLEEMASAELVAAGSADAAAPAVRRAAANVIDDREPVRALVMRQKLLAETGESSDASAVAVLLARTGDHEAAEQMLAGRVAADPWDVRARLLLAEMYRCGGQAASALALIEQWLAVNPDDVDAMRAASRCWPLLRGGDTDAQAQLQGVLREILAVEPNRRDEERYVEFLESGEGGDTVAFYTPYVVDADALVKADPGAPPDAIAAKDPLRWLMRQQVERANGNGTTNSYVHDVVRILTEEGARSMQYYSLPYYRGEQRGRMLSCTLYRADGTVERPALSGPWVRLPDLRPGDVVSASGRVDDLAPSFFGDYFGLVHSFAANDGSPVQQSELIVLADPGREYRWQATNGAPEPERSTLEDGTLLYRWRMADLSRDVPETRRPSRRETDPTVRMTTYRDWDQFAAWWWDLIKNQLEVTPSMRETVARVCAGLDDTQQKIAAIYHFVTTDVRYEAWEFGVHGYKPYSTAIIHERRHGDCKDKALLLCALLGEIGVECRPVLIFADPLRSKDDLTLPMVQQFNHCIGFMPAQDGRPARFLDGTAIWHPPDTLPEMDQGAEVLVVDHGKADLRTIEWTTPELNRDRSELVFELGADGGATLRIEETPIGNRAVGLRAELATEPARRREVVEQSLVRRFGKLTVTSIDTSDPAEQDAVRLAAEATVPEIGRRSNGRWQLPSNWGGDELQSLPAESERKAPVLLGTPYGDANVMRYRVPPGWRVEELPAPTRLESPFGRFRLQWRRDGNDVVVERTLEFTAPRLPASEQPELAEFVSAVKAADAKLVLLQKEGR